MFSHLIKIAYQLAAFQLLILYLGTWMYMYLEQNLPFKLFSNRNSQLLKYSFAQYCYIYIYSYYFREFNVVRSKPVLPKWHKLPRFCLCECLFVLLVLCVIISTMACRLLSCWNCIIFIIITTNTISVSSTSDAQLSYNDRHSYCVLLLWRVIVTSAGRIH
jgi:hypothetical protein